MTYTTLKQCQTLFFWGSKIIADGDCSHEIKRCLLLGRKVITNLDSILKSRDTTLPTKIHLVKAIVFSSGHVWMWELDYEESWEPKNRCFWTVVLEKTLESPLDCKEVQPVHPKGDQSWVFTGRTDAKETLATWCKELTHWKRPWCWEGLGAGGEGDNRGWDGWMVSPTQWTWVWVSSGSWWWTGRPGMLWFMVSQRVGHDWATELKWMFTGGLFIFHAYFPNTLSHWAVKTTIKSMPIISFIGGRSKAQRCSFPRFSQLVIVAAEMHM